MTPGIRPGLAMAEYLAAPAVSASLVKKILDECPAAAWFSSYLNPNPETDDSSVADRGTSDGYQIYLRRLVPMKERTEG